MSKRHHSGDSQSKTKKKKKIEPTEAVEEDFHSLECIVKHMEQATYKNLKKAEKQLLEKWGWKSNIQYTDGIDIQYTSPDGTIICDSLRQVYEYLSSIFGKYDDFSSDEQEAILAGPVPHGPEEPNLAEEPVVHEEEDSEQIVPIHCPEALTDWLLRESGMSKEGGIRKLTLKAKQHLVAIGWRLEKILKSKGKGLPKVLELRYISPAPKKKSYTSLATACRAVLGLDSSNKAKVPSLASSSAASSSEASASFPPSCKSASIDAENAVDWKKKLHQKIEDMNGDFFMCMDDIYRAVSQQKFLPGMGEMCYEDIQAIHDEITKKLKQFKEALVSPPEPVSAQQQIQQPDGNLPSIQPNLQEQEQQLQD